MGIRLLVGYDDRVKKLNITALDEAGAYKAGQLIGAMVQFEDEPAMNSALTGENAMIQCTCEKRNKTRETFSKNRSLAKIRRKFFVLMNVPNLHLLV
jgi:hypothetical protein